VHTVFVTGADGFAGGHVLKRLTQAGYDTVAGVRNRARKLAYERNSQKALVCDVTDAIGVARVVASVRPDAVLHLAGPSSPAAAAADPLLAYQSIVTAWANVLDAVRRTVPRAKVVLASACDVYGAAGDDDRPLPESTPVQPISTFGSLKRTAETIAHTFYRDYHLNVTIARPFHYTGPGQPENLFIGSVARAVIAATGTTGPAVLEVADLRCRRDILHVADVATAYTRLIEDGRPDEIYNICSGNSLEINELVAAIAAEAGVHLQLSERPTPPEDNPVRALRGSNQKLRDELHWQPTNSVEDAVKDLVASYRPQAATVAH